MKSLKYAHMISKSYTSYFFSLLLRQYNCIGELMLALAKTYAISSMTKKDVTSMWLCLSKIRALLPVQMSQEEEALMRQLLWSVPPRYQVRKRP